jgi:hypothetical protein
VLSPRLLADLLRRRLFLAAIAANLAYRRGAWVL